MPISDKAYLAKYLKPATGSSGSSDSWMEEKKRKVEKDSKIIIPKSYGRADSDEEDDDQVDDEQEVMNQVGEKGSTGSSSEPLENQLKRKRHDSDDEDEDLSPVREPVVNRNDAPSKRRHDSDDDEDLSPPRPSKESVVQKKRHDSDDEDLSPVREPVTKRRHDSDDDLSPVRGSTRSEAKSDAHSTAKETSENQTVYRHPETKKIITFEEYSELMKKKKRQTKKITQNEITWAKGLKQQEERQEMISEFDSIKSGEYKPIYETDSSYNQLLKEQLKEEDPMARLITEKKKNQQDSKKSKTKKKKFYDGPHPENRFNIKPGWRWDGVDRSNGFENQYFKHMNNVKDREDREFLWSNADL
ncbi:predicted protein [Naegleria gruberi]|uniref:Predicted protein n=1 Tax=Naegleria gruberi TaxID=5762 RepID=D2V9K2_NAEGR|nr:uncharacterized protein NAEGRDRAFT_47716 [Naegleria gruberi]EFC46476.1 predicted protein [Naegleria gruberi]|eukprot:XP_002679220.1 predicted protein [Naegleria gruberi strain NEG-M]